MVSFESITRMEGFSRLTREQMDAVLNNPVNFIGLSRVANSSKGSKTYAQWIRYKKGGIDVDPVFRRNAMEAEIRIASELQRQIDGFLQ